MKKFAAFIAFGATGLALTSCGGGGSALPPANGSLWILTADNKLVSIDKVTGTLGTPITITGGAISAIDVDPTNPTVLYGIEGGTNDEYLISVTATTATAFFDTAATTFAAGRVGAAYNSAGFVTVTNGNNRYKWDVVSTPFFTVELAFTTAGASISEIAWAGSTLYGIDFSAANQPSLATLSGVTVSDYANKLLGTVVTTTTNNTGFCVDTAGTAFAVLKTSGGWGLYRVSLSTGSATQVGAFFTLSADAVSLCPTS